MKVKIRNYPTWINSYQIATKLSFGKFETLGPLTRPIDSICQKFYDWQKKRRVQIKIDRWDTWNVDSTLAPIIVKLLRQYISHVHGAPGDMPAFANTDEGAQDVLGFYKDDTTVAWDAGQAQWIEILNKMLWSFEQMTIDWESQYHTGVHDIQFVPVEGKDLVEMVRGPNDTSHFDVKGYDAHSARIQEGLELFGKYYRNLWD